MKFTLFAFDATQIDLRVTDITGDADVNRLASIDLALLRGVVSMWTSALTNGTRTFRFKRGRYAAARAALAEFGILLEESPPLAKRYFKVDAGATYTIVAEDPSDAWRLFGAHIAVVEGGEDLLGEDVAMREIPAEGAADKKVHDEDGPNGTRTYPLTEAELGAVFCSEY